jgi:hypothetical protein
LQVPSRESSHQQFDELTDAIRAAGLPPSTASGVSPDFKNLMRMRINEILLVSSLYDYDTLVDDGQLSEVICVDYVEINNPYTPHITRVASGDAALLEARAVRSGRSPGSPRSRSYE